MKISVLIKEPGKSPRHVWIENSLKNLQQTVGGYIEVLRIATDGVIICNEEGRLMGLPYCCTVADVDFVGTIVLAGVAGDEFCDWPLSYKVTKHIMPCLWEGKEHEQE